MLALLLHSLSALRLLVDLLRQLRYYLVLDSDRRVIDRLRCLLQRLGELLLDLRFGHLDLRHLHRLLSKHVLQVWDDLELFVEIVELLFNFGHLLPFSLESLIRIFGALDQLVVSAIRSFGGRVSLIVLIL